MKPLRSLLCCILVLCLAATAPGLAPYAFAGEALIDARATGNSPVVNRIVSQPIALPNNSLRSLSAVGTISAVSQAESTGLDLPPIAEGSGLVQTGFAPTVKTEPEVMPVAAEPEQTPGFQDPARTEKEIAPSLQVIAEPKSSGESSAGAGDEVSTILQGGKGFPKSAVDLTASTKAARWRQLLGRAVKGSGLRTGSLFAVGAIGAGTIAAGRVAAGLIVVPLMLVAFVLHEWAHACVAYWLGDPQPVLENRGSLDPRDWGVHFHWLWSIVLPISTYFTLHTMMGGAKPVEFDSRRFTKTGPVLGAALAAFAGPGVNLVLAGLGALAFAGLGALSATGAAATALMVLTWAAVTFGAIRVVPSVVEHSFLRPVRAWYEAEAAKHGPGSEQAQQALAVLGLSQRFQRIAQGPLGLALGVISAAGLAAVAVTGAWAAAFGALVYAVGLFAVMNAAIAFFNLIPVFPLDGYHIAKAMIPGWLPEGVKNFLRFFLGDTLAAEHEALAKAQSDSDAAVREFGPASPQAADAAAVVDKARGSYSTARVLTWIPFVLVMGVLLKFGLGVMAVSWLASFLLGGTGAAALHLAAAVLPATAGIMVGQLRDTGVSALGAHPEVAEHRLMKSRLVDVRRELALAAAEPTRYDPEWVESLARQADGYEVRLRALESEHPGLARR